MKRLSRKRRMTRNKAKYTTTSVGCEWAVRVIDIRDHPGTLTEAVRPKSPKSTYVMEELTEQQTN